MTDAVASSERVRARVGHAPRPSQVPSPPLSTRFLPRKWMLWAASTRLPCPLAPTWVWPAGAPGESQDGRQERGQHPCPLSSPCWNVTRHQPVPLPKAAAPSGWSPSYSLWPLWVPASTLLCPFAPKGTNGPAVAGPGALHQPWLLSPCDPALAFIRNAVEGLSLTHLEHPT